MKLLSCVQLFATPWTVAHQASPWDSPSKNPGVGCHFLLQGIFPTQGLNPGLLHCRQTLYHLSHQGRLDTVEERNNKAKGSFIAPYLLISLCIDGTGRRQWHSTPVLLPGKSHGWRSLVGYRPWGRKELDTTERLHFTLEMIGATD